MNLRYSEEQRLLADSARDFRGAQPGRGPASAARRGFGARF